jgi:hypothetical protein
MRLKRHLPAVLGWMLLVLYVAAIKLWSLETVWSHTVLLIVWAVGAYAIYQGIYWFSFWPVNRRRLVSVEDGQLVQRTRTGCLVDKIDLAEPFNVECRYDGVEWVLYRVSQEQHIIRIALDASGDGTLVREILHQPWPPAIPSRFPDI